jgi:hypothetical protein
LKRLIILGLVAVLVVVMSAPAVLLARGSDGNGGHGKKKVTLCHKGKKTIKVGKPAKRAHLAHGDTKGPCNGNGNGNGNGDDDEECIPRNGNDILTASRVEYCDDDDDNGKHDDDNGKHDDDNGKHGDDGEDRP